MARRPVYAPNSAKMTRVSRTPFRKAAAIIVALSRVAITGEPLPPTRPAGPGVGRGVEVGGRAMTGWAPEAAAGVADALEGGVGVPVASAAGAVRAAVGVAF